MKVELVYEPTCPNAPKAREMIRNFLAHQNRKIEYLEINKEDQNAPSYATNLTSPTILVDGKDIVPGSNEGSACRIYRDEDGKLSGIPPESALKKALFIKDKPGSTWKLAAALPVLGGLVPAVSCGACWPLYTAILGGLGISFFNYSPFLVPALFGIGILAVSLLFWFGYKTKRWLEVGLGAAGAVLIVFSRAYELNNAILYSGMALSILSLPAGIIQKKKTRTTKECADC